MTRIIAGHRKGLHLHNPKNKRIRPTSDRVKEWIFSVLGPLDEITVLDLYCGAGNLGIEALSRGAASAVFVDASRDAMTLTGRNIERARFTEQATLVRQDCLSYLHRSEERFHLAFADPPYQHAEGKSLFNAVQNVLYLQAMFVFESDSPVQFPIPAELSTVREKSLGTTTVTLLRKTS